MEDRYEVRGMGGRKGGEWIHDLGQHVEVPAQHGEIPPLLSEGGRGQRITHLTRVRIRSHVRGKPSPRTSCDRYQVVTAERRDQ